MKKLSVVYTNYNRYDSIVESIHNIHDFPNIEEIIVNDDCSDLDIYNRLAEIMQHYPKVHLRRNNENMDCFRNKRQALSQASNEWCCLLDSDNQFSFDYFEAIIAEDWEKDTILAPSFAQPHFRYTEFSGMTFDRSNVASHYDRPMLGTAFNTCNFFVNKDEYLRVWDGSVDPVTSDSIYFIYLWLNAGNKVKIVDGMRYEHPISDDSHYKKNVSRTPNGFHEEVERKIRELR
jgi:glycosyltransferase involved in cell wall biosynthesis